jgi:phosphoribosylformylglycinamidine synthase
VITVNDEQENELVDFLFNEDVPITLLGHVTKGELRMDDLSFGFIEDYIQE